MVFSTSARKPERQRTLAEVDFLLSQAREQMYDAEDRERDALARYMDALDRGMLNSARSIDVDVRCYGDRARAAAAALDLLLDERSALGTPA